MIVADNSVVTELLVGDGPQVRAIQEHLENQRVFVPDLLDLEAVSAVRRLVLAGELEASAGQQAIATLIELPFERVSHRPLVPRIWQLKDNLTPYDASYVALAEHLDVPLYTGDMHLARSPGIRCPVILLS